MLTRRAVATAYLLSGAAGLLYEIVWVRLLTLQLGHTVAAVSTVLAAFMGGLALGAALAARYAPALERPRALRAYAWVEFGIAACALLIAPALEALRPLLAWSYADGTGGARFAVTRVLVSLALVAVPTTLMGATLPLVVRWFGRSARHAGVDVGALYAANTVGAAAGALSAGFVLLPTLGLLKTTLVGAALNGAAAALALRAARQRDEDAVPDRSGRGATPGARSPRAPSPALPGRTSSDARPRPLVAAAALGLSGFAALAYEVVWTRTLVLVLGPTVYAFSAMLVAVIAGLALGSGLGARVAARWSDPAPWLVGVLLLPPVVAFTVGRTLDALPLAVARTVAEPDATFGSVVRLQAQLLGAMLVPMSAGFGAAFPLAVALAAGRDEAVARDTGLVYSINTVGAIAGSLAAGFLLLPALGLRGTFLAAGLIALAAAGVALLAVRATRLPRASLAAALAGTAAFGLTMPSWNPALLSSGAYKYAAYLRDSDLQSSLEAGRLLYYAEAPTATVSVREVAGSRSLAIDGKVDASNTGDMLTQKLLAHLPLLLHPAPADVCIIGWGSGVTAGAALRHPVRRVEVVEISPEVVAASRFFARENHEALADPRTRLVLGDARTHLLLGSGRYDVIVSEPSNPWMAGVASLFTREVFEAARRRLRPGGILCQWAHTYDIREADLRSIVATFASVFPDGAIWLVGEGDLLLLGSDGPVDARLSAIARAWQRPGVAADLAEVGVRSPFALLTMFVGGGAALRAFAAGAAIQRDDHAPLEFSAPRAIYGASGDNAALLTALARATPRPAPVARALADATAADWRDRGAMLLQAEAFQFAYEDFARAVTLDPADPAALAGLSQAAAGARRQAEALALLRGLCQAHPHVVPLQLELSRVLAASGAYAEAAAVAEEVVRAQPASLDALAQLASVLADAGDADRLAPVVSALERRAPADAATMYYAATLHFLQGDYAAAATLAERLVARDTRHHRAWNLLGAAYGNLGRADAARRAFEAARQANPRDPATHVNLGLFELQAANPAAAVHHFAEALALEPTSAAALTGLADALERLGYLDRASRIRSRVTALGGRG